LAKAASHSRETSGCSVVVTDVIKIYKTKEVEVVALRGLSMSVKEGECVAIMGPSGSGKTTLLNLVGGIDLPSAGSIVVDGLELTKLSLRQLEEYRLKRVGYVFQLFNLIPSLTASENVELPMVLAKVPRRLRKRRVEELLEMLGIKERANHKPDELSGGEKQRVAIAAALANDPPLILADEPTGELDTENAMKVTDILVGLSREMGKTVIIATHDPRVARRADRILLIEDGRITGEYLPAQVDTLVPKLTSKGVELPYVEHLRKRMQEVKAELKHVEEAFRKGEISADEFNKRYTELKIVESFIKGELARHGLVTE